jgi:chemotaxis protein MotB
VEEEEEKKCEPGAPGWVVTFGDMMSLLLTFFILLLSFARLEKTRFKVLASSMKKAFGVQNVTPRQTYEDGRSPIMKHFSLPFNSSEVVDQMKNIVARQQSRSPQGKVDIQVDQNNMGVLVTFPFESIFESGSADIRPEVWPMLDDIAKKLKENNAQIRVSAFTDDIPISSAVFASNDHLSAARSVSLVRYLHNTTANLPVERFEAIPFGPNRPIAPNISKINRERNRRVEVLFYTRPSADWKSVKDGLE